MVLENSTSPNILCAISYNEDAPAVPIARGVDIPFKHSNDLEAAAAAELLNRRLLLSCDELGSGQSLAVNGLRNQIGNPHTKGFPK
jgi:hypothetical protein